MYHLPDTALDFLFLVSSCNKNQNPLHDWQVDPISHLTSSPTSQDLPHALLQRFSFLQGPSVPSSLVSDGRLHPTPSYIYTCVPLASPGSLWLFTVTYAGKPPLNPPALGMSKFLICPLSSTYHHHPPMLTMEFLFQICLPCKSVNSMKVQLSCVFTTESQVPRPVFLKL